MAMQRIQRIQLGIRCTGVFNVSLHFQATTISHSSRETPWLCTNSTDYMRVYMNSQPNALMNAFIWMFDVILDMTVYVMKMTTNKSKRET